MKTFASAAAFLLATLAASRPALKSNPHIVGGTPVSTNPYPYPFMAAVTYMGQQYCGASLIAPDWVLTAAHCDVYVNDVLILGTPDKIGDLENPNRVAVSVAAVFNHPNYNSGTEENDIALLRLSTSVNTITPLQVLTSPDVALEGDGVLATLAGWGHTTQGGTDSQFLLEVAVPIVSNAVCLVSYPGAILDSMMCAGLVEGGKDTCQGDSGGPMFVGNVQVGIVSWGNGCAQPNFFGVYTRTSSFGSWMDTVMNGGEVTNAPTQMPTKAPVTGNVECTPSVGGDIKSCARKIRQCGQANRMRWTGKGCRQRGVVMNDGGCQCYGYCGFTCKSACQSKLNRDFCKWEGGLCKTLAGVVTGPIGQC